MLLSFVLLGVEGYYDKKLNSFRKLGVSCVLVPIEALANEERVV